MIRAGRRSYVRTLDDLARSQNSSPRTFRNTQPYKHPEFPAPISSAEARILLWDGEQTDAHYAGGPIPELPAGDHEEDLLDRREAAAVLKVDPKSWDNLARKDSSLQEAETTVAGVKHWPRRSLTAFTANRPGKGVAAAGRQSGRPKGSGDLVPRDELQHHVAGLLDEDPAITAAAVREELGVDMKVALTALARLRGQRIADLLESEPDLEPDQAAERLGYPPITRRGALAAVAREQRARAVRPYLRSVADELAGAGLAPAGDIEVQIVGDDALATAVVLTPDSDVAALVWDERYGWRTATSRRHPFGPKSATPPKGAGIRYFGTDATPAPERVVAWLNDARAGLPAPPRRRRE